MNCIRFFRHYVVTMEYGCWGECVQLCTLLHMLCSITALTVLMLAMIWWLFCSIIQAFGAVEAMSDRVCIASNGTVQAHISAEDLLSCCHRCGLGYALVLFVLCKVVSLNICKLCQNYTRMAQQCQVAFFSDCTGDISLSHPVAVPEDCFGRVTNVSWRLQDAWGSLPSRLVFWGVL